MSCIFNSQIRISSNSFPLLFEVNAYSLITVHFMHIRIISIHSNVYLTFALNLNTTMFIKNIIMYKSGEKCWIKDELSILQVTCLIFPYAGAVNHLRRNGTSQPPQLKNQTKQESEASSCAYQWWTRPQHEQTFWTVGKCKARSLEYSSLDVPYVRWDNAAM